jgi:hypothetical protein
MEARRVRLGTLVKSEAGPWQVVVQVRRIGALDDVELFYPGGSSESMSADTDVVVGKWPSTAQLAVLEAARSDLGLRHVMRIGRTGRSWSAPGRNPTDATVRPLIERRWLACEAPGANRVDVYRLTGEGRSVLDAIGFYALVTSGGLLASATIHWCGHDDSIPSGYVAVAGADAVGRVTTWLFAGTAPSAGGYLGRVVWHGGPSGNTAYDANGSYAGSNRPEGNHLAALVAARGSHGAEPADDGSARHELGLDHRVE